MTDVAGVFLRMARGAALAAVGFVAIAVELAPIASDAGWPAPDLLLCALAAAALRAPAATPAPLVFGLGLARDLLGGGPVGAGALGLVVAVEGLRGAAEALRRRSFGLRWAAATAAAAVAVAIPWLLTTLSLAPAPALADLALGVGATAATYPAVALAMRAALRRAARRGGATSGEGPLAPRRAV